MPRTTKNTSKSGGRAVITAVQFEDATGAPLNGNLLETAGLTAALESSFQAMDWLESSDQAAIELALTYARQIDAANEVAKRAVEVYEADPSQENDPGPALARAQKASYLGAHLLAVLKSLGGTPEDRAALRKQDPGEVPESPLEAMRRKARGA